MFKHHIFDIHIENLITLLSFNIYFCLHVMSIHIMLNFILLIIYDE